MKKPYNNVSVDLESLDVLPTAAIVSIGAVLFNEDGLCPEQFYLTIKQESCWDYGLTTSASTRKFWDKQSEEARAVLNDPKAVDLATALTAYSNWIKKFGGNPKDMVSWSCGSNFDHPILNNAYAATGVRSPTLFYKERCYRTIKDMFPEIQMERESGEKEASHLSIVDAREQARHLIRINDFAKTKGVRFL